VRAYPPFLDAIGRDHKMKKIAILFMVALLLSGGCASAPIDLSKGESVPQNEGVVFGRVKVISGEKTENFTSAFGESTFGVLVLPDGTSKAVYCPLKDDGFFTWHLRPGGYTIAAFEWRHWGISRGRVFAHFAVPKGKVSYIGTLTLVFRGGRYIKFIEDEYGLAIKAFKRQFPEIKEEITKNLFEMEKER